MGVEIVPATTSAPTCGWKPYPAYKDSGVEWIGEIPDHWKVKKLKYLSSKNVEYGLNIGSEFYVNYGIRFLRTTDIDDKGNLSDEGVFLSEKNVEPNYILNIGDFLISRSGTIGRAYVHQKNDVKYSYAGYLVRFRFNNIYLSKFSYYITKTNVFINWLNINSIESTIGNVNGQKYANFSVQLPTVDELMKIVTFLDDRTRKIDSLIEKKQKLIELLKEERTAVINQAVTKGLDPRAPMRDSGVEWLGEVPEKWKVKKLKYVAEVVLGKMLTNDDKGGYFYKPYLRAQNIGWQKVNADDVKQMWFSEKELDQYRVKLNDLLVSEGGEVGRTAIWKNIIEECYIQNSVHKVTMLDGNNPYYFLYLFFLYGQLGYFDSIVSRVSIAHLTREKLKEVFCLIPSIGEQEHIVKHIESESAKIDSAVSIIEKELLLLQEYRTALISEVVTGKIDVREAI